MGKKWVDFKELKRQLDFGQVLEHYKVKLKQKGVQSTGHCPLPTHGEERSPSFSANVPRGIWQCFGCGSHGNALDFAIRMEGKSPSSREDVRAVALEWQARIAGAPPTEKPAKEAPQPKRRKLDEPVFVNQPLDFELKGLDPKHPYFRERGFSEETLEHFGIAYCSRGLMKGRQVIPIQNPEGKLVAYCGRIVDDSLINHENPKYLFPATKEHEGAHYEFRKSLLLYSAHRVIEPATSLIVVERFASVWWLWQHGYKDSVALMGSSCSEEQAAIVLSKVSEDGLVLVMPDGDKAGVRCAHSVFEAVGPRRCVRWVKLEGGRQPTDVAQSKLPAALMDY